MTDMTKAKVYAASLGSVFSEGVCFSLFAPGLSGFDSSEYVLFLFFDKFVFAVMVKSFLYLVMCKSCFYIRTEQFGGLLYGFIVVCLHFYTSSVLYDITIPYCLYL